MKVDYSEKAQKQPKGLDKQNRDLILKYMRDVGNLENPRSRGKSLTSNLAGLWRYRIGDYRAICNIVDSDLLIVTINIGHRRNVYS